MKNAAPMFPPLLVAALREGDAGQRALPVDARDWTALAHAAARSGLSGLVLERAAMLDVAIPAAAHEHLRRAAFAVAAENVHLLQELETVLSAFNRASIPVMLLKGAALNLATYPRRDLRPMSDLDLMVRYADAHRARELLEEIGCTRGAPLLCDDFFPRYYYETEYFTTSQRSARIDLHARPFRPLRYACTVNEHEFWRGATKVQCGSATALVPRLEVMFVHLAAHAAFHGCARLIWLYDLRRFLARHGKDLDRSQVVALSREWSLSSALNHAVRQADHVLGSLPLQDVCAVPRGGWCDRLILARAPRDAESPALHLLSTLVTTPDWHLRWGYLGAHLWPGREHLQQKQGHDAGWGNQMRRWISFVPRATKIGKAAHWFTRRVQRAASAPT